MYKLTQYQSVIRLSDNAFIPMDENNSDYVAYLAWVSEGGVASPPDDVTSTSEIPLSADSVASTQEGTNA